MKHVSRKDQVDIYGVMLDPYSALVSYLLDAVTADRADKLLDRCDREERSEIRKRLRRRLANFAWACRCHKALKYDVPAVDTLIATWNGSDERSV